jgi:DNA-binding Lrp family transcriptional regulator
VVFKTNDKQVLLLTELRKNARQSITRIGHAINMPISTVHDKIRANTGGVVKKYTCVLDFSRLGFSCRAQIILKVNKCDKDDIRQHLLKTPNINSIYRINNGYDFLIEGVFRDLRDIDEFMERLEELYRIKEKRIYYIMEDIARETFMTDPVHAEMVGI